MQEEEEGCNCALLLPFHLLSPLDSHNLAYSSFARVLERLIQALAQSQTCCLSSQLPIYPCYPFALVAQTINVCMSMSCSSCACTVVDSVSLPLHTTNMSVINRYRSKHMHSELFAHWRTTVSYTEKLFLLEYNYQGKADFRVHHSKNTEPSLNWGKHLQNASKGQGKDEFRLKGTTVTYQLQMQRRNSCLGALAAGPSPSCPFAHFACRWAPGGSSCLSLGQ